MAVMKMRLRRASMMRHITMLSSRRKGARTVTRSICWKAFCRLFTSVVMRVTRPDVEKRSMSWKENVWMLRYMARRRLAAKPVEA